MVLRADGDRVELQERRAVSVHDLHPSLALLLSTSGSSGSPKLVRLSRRNLLANATAIAEALQVRDDDRAVTTLPLHYCYGLSVVHSHLLRGAALVLTERSVLDEGSGSCSGAPAPPRSRRCRTPSTCSSARASPTWTCRPCAA